MTEKKLQNAITLAVSSGLPAIDTKTFEFTAAGWKPRPECLTEYYSAGEAVVCSILLSAYLEFYGFGARDHIVVPDDRDYVNSITDLIWPGAYYVRSAASKLSDRTCWDAIKMLLPGDKGVADTKAKVNEITTLATLVGCDKKQTLKAEEIRTKMLDGADLFREEMVDAMAYFVVGTEKGNLAAAIIAMIDRMKACTSAQWWIDECENFSAINNFKSWMKNYLLNHPLEFIEKYCR